MVETRELQEGEQIEVAGQDYKVLKSFSGGTTSYVYEVQPKKSEENLIVKQLRPINELTIKIFDTEVQALQKLDEEFRKIATSRGTSEDLPRNANSLIYSYFPFW